MGHTAGKHDSILSKFAMNGRAAIVTGAGRGIGRGISLSLAGAGADVAVVDLDEERGRRTAEEIRSKGRKAFFIKADVTNGKAVQRMVEEAVAEFGKIDILVNNAGGSSGARVPPLEMSEEIWDKSIALNLKAAFLCIQAAGKTMIRQGGGGSIVNISSAAALRGQMLSVAYSAAKAGIINLTLSMSNYLAPHHIRVNTVTPGNVVSEGVLSLSENYAEQVVKEYEIPLGRVGQPEDIAAAVIFLASDASQWITGINIEVRGGEYLGGRTLKRAESLWQTIKKT